MTPLRSPFAPSDGEAGDVRRSLVLAGGGMRVAYQAGVLRALEEAGLRFHHADGASGGTMSLSMLLGGQSSAEMCERWRTLDPRRFSTPLPLREYVRSPRWPGLGSARGLSDQVFPHLGIDAGTIRAAEGIVGTYNVGNFATKTAQVVEHRDVDLDLLIAAVSLPVLMPAVERDGTAYTDAVWIRDSNVPEAVRRGSDEIWLIWCIGNTPRYRNGSFRQYVHMIEMAANGSLLRDLDYVAARWPDRPVRLHVIKPARPIPLDPDYYFGRIDAATLIDLGYQDARRYLDQPRPLSAPWGPETTRMADTVPGATARLDLSGTLGFVPAGESAAGTAMGASDRRRRATLRLRVQIGAPSRLRADDPAPLEVAGDVSVSGEAPRALLEAGGAHLDRRGPTFRLRWSVAGSTRALLVEPGSRPDVLRATLHAGDDGPVLATGTLDWGWRQAARALSTLHARDCTSGAQAARARGGLAVSLVRALGRSGVHDRRDGKEAPA